jgi:hypothetical protein
MARERLDYRALTNDTGTLSHAQEVGVRRHQQTGARHVCARREVANLSLSGCDRGLQGEGIVCDAVTLCVVGRIFDVYPAGDTGCVS